MGVVCGGVVCVNLVMIASLGGVRDAPINRARLWCLVFFRIDT